MARKSPSDGPASAAAQARELRNRRIWELHCSGLTTREIGPQVNLDYSAVSRVIRAMCEEDSSVWTKEQVRQVADAQLLSYLAAIKPGINDGDLSAIAEARKLNESRRKLYGADGAVDVNVNHTAKSPVDQAIRNLLRPLDGTVVLEGEDP